MLRKILFVDDDQILRFAVEKHLATYSDHFSVAVASDGFDAVKKLQSMPFSLVVLDLIMPRMDGMSLIGHIRDNYPDIPIIIVSGMPSERVPQLTEASGIVAYFNKPFQADELVTAIMNTLRKEAEGGIMYDVSPAVFLQFMEMDCKTCTIRILDKTSKQGGILYFIDGGLVDARVGELHGIDAALKIFTWDAVTIFLRNDCPPRPDIINSGLQPIIMKAAGMKDESEDPADDEEDPPASPPAEENDLDTLVLPEDFAAAISFEQPAGGKDPDDDKEEKQTILRLEDLKDLIEKSTGTPCKADQIVSSEALDKVVAQLKELGVQSQFGNFQIGYVDTGKDSHQFLLPGQPSVAVRVQTTCPKDKIIEVLCSGSKIPFRQ